MPKGNEFDRVYEDGPRVQLYRLGEELVPEVVRAQNDLSQGQNAVEIQAIQRRLNQINHQAVIIALRHANESRLLQLDEADGVVYPPLRPFDYGNDVA